MLLPLRLSKYLLGVSREQNQSERERRREEEKGEKRKRTGGKQRNSLKELAPAVVLNPEGYVTGGRHKEDLMLEYSMETEFLLT